MYKRLHCSTTTYSFSLYNMCTTCFYCEILKLYIWVHQIFMCWNRCAKIQFAQIKWYEYPDFLAPFFFQLHSFFSQSITKARRDSLNWHKVHFKAVKLMLVFITLPSQSIVFICIHCMLTWNNYVYFTLHLNQMHHHRSGGFYHFENISVSFASIHTRIHFIFTFLMQQCSVGSFGKINACLAWLGLALSSLLH